MQKRMNDLLDHKEYFLQFAMLKTVLQIIFYLRVINVSLGLFAQVTPSYHY